MDSNHRRHCQQIYSLSPLATREFPHMNFCRPFPRLSEQSPTKWVCEEEGGAAEGASFRACAEARRSGACSDVGAGGRTRTPDLLITKTIRSVQTLIYQRFWAFPLDPNVLSRPVISVVSIGFFRVVGHGVGRSFSGGAVVVPQWVIRIDKPSRRGRAVNIPG